MASDHNWPTGGPLCGNQNCHNSACQSDKKAVKTAGRFYRGGRTKASGKWVTVALDVQVWLKLFAIKLESEKTPNDVVRRLTGLGPRRKA